MLKPVDEPKKLTRTTNKGERRDSNRRGMMGSFAKLACVHTKRAIKTTKTMKVAYTLGSENGLASFVLYDSENSKAPICE